MKPKKSLGQNFLNNAHYLEKIAKECIVDEMNIIEIGPGSGNLTKAILKNTDNKLLSIEIDERMTESLDTIKNNNNQFDYIISDVLRAHIDYTNKVVCGNLPYNVGTRIVIHLIEQNPDKLVFLLQKEVVQKLSAKENSKDYSGISVLLQAFYQVKAKFVIPPDAFFPVPKVDSQVIVCTKTDNNDVCFKTLSKILRYSFSARRKMLRNTLCKQWPEAEKYVDTTRRPETLSVNEYIELSRRYKERLCG